eukprot:scaffold33165_cov144-Isochrysis_galbana.AAC.1
MPHAPCPCHRQGHHKHKRDTRSDGMSTMSTVSICCAVACACVRRVTRYKRSSDKREERISGPPAGERQTTFRVRVSKLEPAPARPDRGTLAVPPAQFCVKSIRVSQEREAAKRRILLRETSEQSAHCSYWAHAQRRAHLSLRQSTCAHGHSEHPHTPRSRANRRGQAESRTPTVESNSQCTKKLF